MQRGLNKRWLRLVCLFGLLGALAVILSSLPGAFGGPPVALARTGPPATGNIAVHEGVNPGEVVVFWDAVPQATHYRIGYVNMEVDYHLAKASCTEEWIEGFVYIDVNARNIPVNNGRAEYTVRRLSQGARHAFTVLTSNDFVDSGGGGSVGSEFFWPSNPRWRFLEGRRTLPPGMTLPSGECYAPAAENPRLAALFNDIISKTERREAFSPVKEQNIGFSVLDDMRALRSEFVAAQNDTELYYALVKLSNARRDRHLRVRETDGGILPQEETTCEAAPIYVLPDLTDDRNPTFFVARLRSQLTSPQVGDVIVAVNGLSMEESIREFTNWIRHSTLHGLYWRMANELPQKRPGASVPQELYSERLNLTLQRSTGERYNVSLPYGEICYGYSEPPEYHGFDEVMERENFDVLLDRSRGIAVLRWYDFEYSLIQDIIDLMEYAERERILDYDMIIDVTGSGGGSRGAYAIQRLVDEPFRVTFGNVRLSDLGVWLVEHFAAQQPDDNAPDIFGLNLSGSWLIDWARTDAMEAIRRGDEYTPPVPFKLAHLPKDSDGILQPAAVRFSGDVVIINAGVWGGSHLDQFVSMFVDNDLATFIGMPTGGYSNTWEVIETLRMPDTRRPLARFMWTAGHTIRPNGEILEGNPAEPHEYIPLTRENFQGYHQTLFNRAMVVLGR